MRGRILILLVFFAALSLKCFPQDSDNDKKLLLLTGINGEAEVTVPYSSRIIDLLTRNVSVISVKDKTIRISLSPLTVRWFIDQRFSYQVIERAAAKNIETAASVEQAMAWDTYPSYVQYDSIMKSFTELYPALCQMDTIGTSVNGRLVLALKISDNPGTDEDEPEVFYTSSMHGNEPAGFVLMLRFIDYLLKNYNTSERIKTLTDNLEIWINPLANPDGAYRSGGVISSQSVRYNANGIDLNRNFPDPVDDSPVKAKETTDMISFMRKHRFVLSANFHSGEEVVNYPWDRWLSKFHADDSWFYSLSREYADTVHKYSSPSSYMTGFNNGITRGAEWYRVYGGRQDFVTGELQGREVTIELDESLLTPAAQLPLLWIYNYRSFIVYLENALYGIHGMTIDKKTSHPVRSRIFITGHDKDSSHVYSDITTGSFVRFLSPGLWDLTVTAKGYRDTIVTNVTVSPFTRTDLLIPMSPVSTDINNPVMKSTVLYPNPASDEIRSVPDGQMAGEVNIRIFDQTGRKIMDYDTVYENGVPLLINVSNLSPGSYSVVFSSKTGMNSRQGRFVVFR